MRKSSNNRYRMAYLHVYSGIKFILINMILASIYVNLILLVGVISKCGMGAVWAKEDVTRTLVFRRCSIAPGRSYVFTAEITTISVLPNIFWVITSVNY